MLNWQYCFNISMGIIGNIRMDKPPTVTNNLANTKLGVKLIRVEHIYIYQT